MCQASLSAIGINVRELVHQASTPHLIRDSLVSGESELSVEGALCVRSGSRCGRSPRDKRIVEHPAGQQHVWWGPVNQPLRPVGYRAVRQRAIDYLNALPRLYVVDGFLGWDPRYRLKVRMVAGLPYHAMFMKNMLIEPTVEEAEAFGEPDFWVFNAGRFPADPHTPDLASSTCIALDLNDRELVILGTEYAGEMKKGLFTYLNYQLPQQGLLPLHAAANQGAAGDVTLFLGLSGTGKTILAMDPSRSLIGDDELAWSDEGLFNLEGGCYAKCVHVDPQRTPMIHRSIGFSTVLENVVVDPHTSVVDFDDTSLTENTRASFPMRAVPNAKVPCESNHPRQIILLTCDAFGVLPAISRLTLEQTLDFFQLGYTAKIAETEVGAKEPVATFSPCFSGPFVVWHPRNYAQLLRERLERHPAEYWLINTGWCCGPPDRGQRISLQETRAMIDAIHSGSLAHAPTATLEPFGYEFMIECPGVPSARLDPRQNWTDVDAYQQQARDLHRRFETTREQLNLVPNRASHWTDQYHRSAY